jgi:uncharacterized protein (DUF2249 family)
MMGFSPLILDVRPDLNQGQDPFAKIMQAAGQISTGQELLLIAPFEPVPLYSVLEQQGFAHDTENAAPNEWRVTFRRTATAAPGPAAQQMHGTAPLAPAQEGEASAAQQVIQLDTRGMEPPGPLVLILNRLETLGADQRLVAHIDREPLLLFPELVDRGWAYEGASQADGSFIISISRPH